MGNGSPDSVARIVFHESQVTRSITRVIARPTTGSARGDAIPNQQRTRDHPERHIAIYAGMIAVGDKRRTCQSPACPGFRVGAICVGDDRVSARGPRELPSAAGPERNAERRRACSPGTTDGVLRLPRVERGPGGGSGGHGDGDRPEQHLGAIKRYGPLSAF